MKNSNNPGLPAKLASDWRLLNWAKICSTSKGNLPALERVVTAEVRAGILTKLSTACAQGGGTGTYTPLWKDLWLLIRFKCKTPKSYLKSKLPKENRQLQFIVVIFIFRLAFLSLYKVYLWWLAKIIEGCIWCFSVCNRWIH